MDTALVIAASSFVGRHLCHRLRTLGLPFLGTSRREQAGLVPCDLTQPGRIAQVLSAVRPRWIFQCAGATAQSSADDLHHLHVAATEQLLRAVDRHVPGAVVVLFGSAAEYGPVTAEQLPIREDTPPRPRSPYGQSKLAQSHLATELARAHGLRVHLVRPFNLLGPGLGEHYFAAALVARLRKLKQSGFTGQVPITNALATRDWIDGRDVAEAVVRLAVDAPPAPGQVELFNIATGEETPVLALAEHLCQLAGGFEAIAGEKGSSRTEIDRSCGDASRLRAFTGWRPRIDWRESLASMWSSSGDDRLAASA